MSIRAGDSLSFSNWAKGRFQLLPLLSTDRSFTVPVRMTTESRLDLPFFGVCQRFKGEPQKRYDRTQKDRTQTGTKNSRFPCRAPVPVSRSEPESDCRITRRSSSATGQRSVLPFDRRGYVRQRHGLRRQPDPSRPGSAFQPRR